MKSINTTYLDRIRAVTERVRHTGAFILLPPDDDYPSESVIPDDCDVHTLLARFLADGQSADHPDNVRIPLDDLSVSKVNSTARNADLHKAPEVDQFIDHLRMRERLQDPETIARLESGRVAFDELGVFFVAGDEVEIDGPEGRVAGPIHSSNILKTPMGTFHQIAIPVIVQLREGPHERTFVKNIPEYEGMHDVDDLPVRPLDVDAKAQLADRGRRFREWSGPPKHAEYVGAEFLTTGRVVIDTTNDNQIKDLTSDNTDSFSRKKRYEEIPDGDLHRCWPTLPAWVFKIKRQIHLDVNRISPIHYATDAIDRLAMDSDQREAVKALIEHHDVAPHDDVVPDKPFNNVLILDGPPGTGKTATAQALAEMMRSPLYELSAGELGVTPEEVENALRMCMNRAIRWGAQILIDEADVFVEQRSASEVNRNAIVSVFLRELERFPGIVFLTTNRGDSMDPAVLSRATACMRYDNDTATRQHIWKSNLLASGFGSVLAQERAEDFAWRPMNGREIRNAVRTAHALARREDAAGVDEHHLRRAADLIDPTA